MFTLDFLKEFDPIYLDDWIDIEVKGIKLEIKSCQLRVKNGKIKSKVAGRFRMHDEHYIKQIEENVWFGFCITHADQVMLLGFLQAKNMIGCKQISLPRILKSCITPNEFKQILRNI